MASRGRSSFEPDQVAIAPDIETSGAAYAGRFAGPVGAYLLDVQTQSVRRLLSGAPLRGGRVLDVGGGHAQLTRLLLALGVEVWVHGSARCCADGIAPLIEEAEGRLHFVTSSLWALPFADRTFDLVVGIRLLAHVERWQALLAEMARVCRHRLLVEYPPLMNVNVLEPLLFTLKRRVEGDTRHFRCYSKGQLAPVLYDLGFADITQHKQFLMPLVVHRVLQRPGLSRRVEAWCGDFGLTRLLGGPALLLAQRPAASPAATKGPAQQQRAGGATPCRERSAAVHASEDAAFFVAPVTSTPPAARRGAPVVHGLAMLVRALRRLASYGLPMRSPLRALRRGRFARRAEPSAMASSSDE